MTLNKLVLCMAAFSACLLIGIACGQPQADQPIKIESDKLNPGISPADLLINQPLSSCPFSPFYAIWTLNKRGSQHWCLITAEQVLNQNGFTILDPAANQNVHVMGRRSNPEVIVTLVCTGIGQLQTSVVIFAISPDENAAQTAAAQVRDQFSRIISLEGDTVQNPA